MDSDPMVGLSGIAGQSSYSRSVPVTTWMYDDIKPVILQAIGKLSEYRTLCFSVQCIIIANIFVIIVIIFIVALVGVTYIYGHYNSFIIWFVAIFIIMLTPTIIIIMTINSSIIIHDDVIKWKYFPRYWPFVWGIHRSPVNSPHKASDAEFWCVLWSTPE